MSRFWLTAAVGFLVSLIATPAMMWLARKLNIVDRPTHRKIHVEPVPAMGGVAILLGLLAGAAVFVALSTELGSVEIRKAAFIAGAAALAGILGLLDDKFQVRARHKLAWQAAIVLAFVTLGYEFKAFRLPGFDTLDLSLLSVPVTALWMLTIVNAMNLVDGADGLAGSVALVICTITGLMAAYLHDVLAAGLVAAAVSALLAFLLFNWHPAKIYMGDAGSLGLGMFIAALLVSLGQDCWHGLGSPAGEPFSYQIPLVTAVVAYPVLEVSLTVLRRLLRGKPIGSADKGHIHHRLMLRGWPTSHICYAAVFVSLLAGGAVVYSLIQYRGAASWFLVAGGLTLGLGLHFSGVLDAFRISSIKGARPYFLLANHFAAMQTIKLAMVESVAELHALLAQTCYELGLKRFALTVPADGNPGGKHVFTWRRAAQEDAQQQPAPAGFSDRTELSPSGAVAEWTFEPAAIEEDIDVEYRVLMSEFMRRAAARAEQLYRAQGGAPGSVTIAGGPTGNGALLPRRNGTCTESA